MHFKVQEVLHKKLHFKLQTTVYVNMNEVAKVIIVLGAALVALGVVLLYVEKLSFFGKLPGDIRIKGENFSFYFPIATCIVLSVLLTLIAKLFFRK